MTDAGSPSRQDRVRVRCGDSVHSQLAVALAILGLALVLYPSGASWFAAREHASVLREYTVTAATARVPAATDVLARIRIPRIGVDLPVFRGTDPATLMRGVGHVAGTSLPIGGPGTHTVLTAHSGLASAKMFDALGEVEAGDVFTLESQGRSVAYSVRSTRVVTPDEAALVLGERGSDLASLITCTPEGINTHRVLVVGERLPAAATPPPRVSPAGPGFPWWAAGFCVGAAGIFDGARLAQPAKPMPGKLAAGDLAS